MNWTCRWGPLIFSWIPTIICWYDKTAMYTIIIHQNRTRKPLIGSYFPVKMFFGNPCDVWSCMFQPWCDLLVMDLTFVFMGSANEKRRYIVGWAHLCPDNETALHHSFPSKLFIRSTSYISYAYIYIHHIFWQTKVYPIHGTIHKNLTSKELKSLSLTPF